MDLTFHVIFIPGAVRYLLLGVLSLVRRCPYRFRLVSNGLGAEAVDLLRRLARCDDRVEVEVYPSLRPIPHGTLLTLLEHRSIGEFFSFCDPDVLALGPFDAELEALLATCDVFSSGRPAVIGEDEPERGLTGLSIESPGGRPLATTFFAVYRSAPLRRLMDEVGVGFEAYRAEHAVPDRLRPSLADLGLEAGATFDTAKLLNVLAALHDQTLVYADLPGILHLGGTSLRPAIVRARGRARRGWRRFSRRPAAPELTVRERIGIHFVETLGWLFDGRPEPIWPGESESLDAVVERSTTALRTVFATHRDELADLGLLGGGQPT